MVKMVKTSTDYKEEHNGSSGWLNWLIELKSHETGLAKMTYTTNCYCK